MRGRPGPIRSRSELDPGPQDSPHRAPVSARNPEIPGEEEGGEEAHEEGVRDATEHLTLHKPKAAGARHMATTRQNAAAPMRVRAHHER